MRIAGHVIDEAGEAIVAEVLSDSKPLFQDRSADRASFRVWRADTHPDFDAVTFGLKDFTERQRIQNFRP